MRRICRAADQLAEEHPGALLAIVIDAADNAAMAAEEFKGRTFATDLFREYWPANTRLVQLCRPERKALLKAPSTEVVEVALSGFQQSETLEHLQTKFPDANAAQAAELQVLSDGNPRVQAMAMENALSVTEVLEALAIARAKPGEVLDSLLAKQIADVADKGHLSTDELSRLCEALATLHPPIPLEELAEISRVDANAIRGFAVALGRGLYAAGNVLQFRDEPTETWFRNNHGLTQPAKKRFANDLKTFAEASPYVANTLPQLLFEAEMLDDLVELALSDAALPAQFNELQAQEIARSRARYALSAMLRAKRNGDAALLAVAAGKMSSGHSRRITVFRENTDLTACFLEADVVDKFCSSRELAGDWPGSNLHVEASLLSAIEQFQDMARSRLRTAHNNIVSILRLPEGEHGHLSSKIGVEEVADLALAATNIDGPKGGIRYLSLWRGKDFVRRVANRLCTRLADAGRYQDISDLITTRQRRPIQAAAAEVLYEYNIVPTGRVIGELVKGLSARRTPYRQHGAISNQPDIRGVGWILAHGLKFGRINADDVVRILDIHLPARLPDWAGSMSSYSPVASLLAYALRAHVTARALAKEDIASPKILKEIGSQYSRDRYGREFESNIVRLLPWVECWLAAILDGDSEAVITKFASLVEQDLKPVVDYNTPFVFINGVAEVATRILTIISHQDLQARIAKWHENEDGRLARSRLTVARVASRSPRLEDFGLQVVSRGVRATQTDRSDADTRVNALVDLARTLHAVNQTEARTIFEIAVAESQQVGDDLYARWMSLLHTATALSPGTEASRGYRLFQVAEELYRVQGDVDVARVAARLRQMHEPTYFAAVSRCRDRRTLRFDLMLRPAVKRADSEQDPCLALLAFDPQYNWRRSVQALPPGMAAKAAAVLHDFTRYERTSDEVPETSHAGSSTYGRFKEDEPLDISQSFAHEDFTTEAAWNKALQKIRYGDRTKLVQFVLEKHSNRRPDVLDAFGRASAPLSGEFVALAQAAASLPSTPGLQQGLHRLAATFATRFASQICTWIYDHEDDLASIALATGVPARGLLALSFHELGSSAYQLSYADYFQVAARLATTLEPSAAGEVFDSLSDLFEDLAPSETTADGPYQALPVPPTGSSACVAGVIWSALGDTSIAMRWRAAHAVLLLVRLGCGDALESVLRLADGSHSVAPFLDSRLPFYSLHARMWLLLAISRASLEPNACLLASFAPFLISVTEGPHHAVNQVLSQRALVELKIRDVIGAGDVDEDILKRRLSANWIELEYDERHERPNPVCGIENDADDPSHFFFDFGAYWCRYVAEIFGANERSVELLVSKSVSNLEGYEIFASGIDPRADANVYEEGSSWANRSDWPAQDNHSFYLAIHGLLAVAGELAITGLAYKEPESDLDSYSEWLARFLPKRRDGRWLADSRDHPPIPARDLTLASFEPKENWPWSLTADDFAATAGFRGEWVSIWGNGEARHGELSEDVAVESALVPNATALALLVALQTSPAGPYPRGLPTIGGRSDWPLDRPFAVEPWVDSTRYHSGIDEHDERAAGVRFPRASPADAIVARFDLIGDQDMRTWSSHDVVVFRSTVWDDMRRAPYDNESGTQGELLQVRRESLGAILSELDMSLLLTVGLRRQRHESSRSYSAPLRRRTDDDDEFGWLQWSGKAYVVRPDGSWLEY
jgi:hypothetical protein